MNKAQEAKLFFLFDNLDRFEFLEDQERAQEQKSIDFLKPKKKDWLQELEDLAFKA